MAINKTLLNKVISEYELIVEVEGSDGVPIKFGYLPNHDFHQVNFLALGHPGKFGLRREANLTIKGLNHHSDVWHGMEMFNNDKLRLKKGYCNRVTSIFVQYYNGTWDEIKFHTIVSKYSTILRTILKDRSKDLGDKYYNEVFPLKNKVKVIVPVYDEESEVYESGDGKSILSEDEALNIIKYFSPSTNKVCELWDR